MMSIRDFVNNQAQKRLSGLTLEKIKLHTCTRVELDRLQHKVLSTISYD